MTGLATELGDDRWWDSGMETPVNHMVALGATRPGQMRLYESAFVGLFDAQGGRLAYDRAVLGARIGLALWTAHRRARPGTASAGEELARLLMLAGPASVEEELARPLVQARASAVAERRPERASMQIVQGAQAPRPPRRERRPKPQPARAVRKGMNR